MGAAASRVSVHGPVRRRLVARQREMGREGGVVMDGRDIGTAVFPDADVKFYVDAHPRQRAARRQEELAQRGVASDLDTIEREIRERDHADSTRAESPLTLAPDAIHLDTTELGLDEVVRRMLAAVEAVSARARAAPARSARGRARSRERARARARVPNRSCLRRFDRGTLVP